ncbi:MAG: cobalamin B12-binding domain-containing protein [Acidobacteria bacterium]|nr:cobalamin B12-binding domain-containing protein [Acidobacteriota bacterium]
MRVKGTAGEGIQARPPGEEGLKDAAEIVSGPMPNGGFHELSGPLLVALLSGDEGQVRRLTCAAREAGADFARLSRDVIEPALDQIGEMWAKGELSIAEEHLATSLVSRAIGVLAARLELPPPGSPRILFTCLAGEFHELGLRIVTEVAHECGWEAENLGSNVPRESVVRFIAQRSPQAVGISLSLAGHLVEAAKTIEQIRRVCPGIRVLAGGRVFRDDPSLLGVLDVDATNLDVVALRDWLRENRESAARPWKTEGAPGKGASVPSPPEALPESFRKRLGRRES